MKLKDTLTVLDEIRKTSDLEAVDKKSICEKYKIKESQVNFLISVVACERIRTNEFYD